MKFCITICEGLTENEGRELWSKIEQYKVNLTLLDDVAYLYGNSPDDIIQKISDEAVKTHRVLFIERG